MWIRLHFYLEDQDRVFGDGTVGANNLGVHTLVLQPTLRLERLVLLLSELCETPLVIDHDLLATGELVLAASQSFAHLFLMLRLGADSVNNLSNFHTSNFTKRLAECMTHTSLEPISSCAGKHLVDAQNVERVDANTEVESVFSSSLGDVLVHDNASSLKSLGGELFLLLGNEVHDKGKLVCVCPFGADIIDAQFGVGNTLEDCKIPKQTLHFVPCAETKKEHAGIPKAFDYQKSQRWEDKRPAAQWKAKNKKPGQSSDGTKKNSEQQPSDPTHNQWTDKTSQSSIAE